MARIGSEEATIQNQKERRKKEEEYGEEKEMEETEEEVEEEEEETEEINETEETDEEEEFEYSWNEEEDEQNENVELSDELSRIIQLREREMKEANESGTPYGMELKALLSSDMEDEESMQEDEETEESTYTMPREYTSFEELFYDGENPTRNTMEITNEDGEEESQTTDEEEDDERDDAYTVYTFPNRYDDLEDEEDELDELDELDDDEDSMDDDEDDDEDDDDDDDDDDEDDIMTPRRHSMASNNVTDSPHSVDRTDQMERLHVKVVHPTQLYDHLSRDLGELTFLIRWHTPLRKLLVAYCTKLKLPLDIVSFTFDGELLSFDSEDTALMLEMEDYDVIESELQLSTGSIESLFINRLKLEEPVYVQILETHWTQRTPKVRISDGEISVEAQFSEYAFDAAMSMNTFLAQRFAVLKIAKARIEDDQRIHIEACTIVTEPMQSVIGYPKALDFEQIEQLISLRECIYQEFQGSMNAKGANPLQALLATNQQYAELLYLIEKHEKSMMTRSTLLQRHQSTLEAAQEDTCNWPLDFITNMQNNGGLVENLLSVLKCSVCCGLLHEPMSITPCGHSYCRSCITEVMKHNPVCPLCRSDIVDVSRNILGEKILQEFEVRCRNTGCPATFRLEDVDDHFSTCLYQLVVCQYCHKGVPRGELQDHTDSICQSIPCKYQVLGCGFVDSTSMVSKHENACIFTTLCERNVLEKLLSHATKTLALPAEKVATLISDICSFVINHSPQLHKNLALLLHSKLKHRVENVEQLEEFFDGVLLILEHMSLKDRDMFIDQCLYYLAKRALYTYHTSLPNLHSELFFMQLFKEKHGPEMVDSLTCMYKDIEDNNMLDQYWQRYLSEIESPMKPTVSLHVRVLTSGYWLGISDHQTFQYGIPRSISVAESVYSKFYSRVHSYQKLIWQHHLSTALIKATPPQEESNHRRYYFHVTGLQMAILLCFNRTTSLTLEQLIHDIQYEKQDEAIPLFNLKRSIVPLCSGSDVNRILNCSIDIRDIITAPLQSRFSLNMKFNALKRHLKIRSGNRRDVHHHTSRVLPTRSASSNNLFASTHTPIVQCHAISNKSHEKKDSNQDGLLKNKRQEDASADNVKTPSRKASQMASSSTPPPTS